MKYSYIIIVFFIIVTFISCWNKDQNRDSAKVYYIDAERGDDKNNGRFKNPVRTIDRLNELIAQKPGNIFFEGSQIFDGTLRLTNIKDEGEDTIRITSSGTGRALINGGDGEAVRIENCSSIRISNIDTKGDGRKTGNRTNGISVVNSRDCIVEMVTAYGFQKSGLELLDCRNIKVDNVTANDNGFCGIHVMGTARNTSGNIVITNCKAVNNAGDPTKLDNHSGNGILVGVSDSVLIDHCTATDNGWDMPRLGNGPVGIWAWESDNVIIQYCISYRNKTSKEAKDGGGFDFDGGVTNSIIQYCVSYENEGAGYGLFQFPGASDWSNNIIRYCISYNDATTTDGAGSIFVWNGSEISSQLTKCLIHNNIIINSSAPLISFEAASRHEDFLFSNNIFISETEVFSGTNIGSRFLGNVWWNPSGNISIMECGSLDEWSRIFNQEILEGRLIGNETDPRLKGPFSLTITDPYKLKDLTGYKLLPDSPVKDKGLDIRSISGWNIPEQDFFGNEISERYPAEPGIHVMD